MSQVYCITCDTICKHFFLQMVFFLKVFNYYMFGIYGRHQVLILSKYAICLFMTSTNASKAQEFPKYNKFNT
jgi:hypothetical protein